MYEVDGTMAGSINQAALSSEIAKNGGPREPDPLSFPFGSTAQGIDLSIEPHAAIGMTLSTSGPPPQGVTASADIPLSRKLDG